MSSLSRSHIDGESQFIDDRRPAPDEVFVGIVSSPITCGELLGIDFSRCLEHPSFVGAWTAKDLQHNNWGSIVQDQPLLVERWIEYHAEPLALVAVRDPRELNAVLSLVKVAYNETPAVLSLQEAREKGRSLYQATPIVRGDLNEGFALSRHQLSGEFEIGGQEHFYLESQAALAYPLEGGALEVHASSQHSSEVQHVVAHALGLSLHQVVCIVKRMGGAFGGKESQAAPIAAYAALVAHKTRRPARLVLDKDQDMQITGKRHPFLSQYRVGFSDQGKILALDVHHYADAGAYTDLSPSILDRALFHTDGCYYLPHVRLQGTVLKTNHHSNTAFRGFGGPQGTFLIEKILGDIAFSLGLDPFVVRQRNLYSEDNQQNLTPYLQEVEASVLQSIFQELKTESQYLSRQTDIEKFNSSQSFRQRSLSVTGVKFGIAFTARFLNQANALVILNRDGTVMVATGATEMGQGVNEKIQVLVASEFGIPTDQVMVMPTRSDRNANASPTAASSGSDLNGAAAVKACQELKRRLTWVAENMRNQWQARTPQDELGIPPAEFSGKDFAFSNTYVTHSSGQKWTFADLIFQAYQHRLSLSEYAHFRTEGLGYDKQKGIGTPFKYFTQGAALSEVEVDLLTGEVKVRRVDIIMDIGKSIHPAIDRGQITGAFVQGLGWVTTEKLHYSPKGALLTHSPTTYKIPNVQDTPREFNLRFFTHLGPEDVVYRSKAVGEPPFLLAISVWSAIQLIVNRCNQQISKLSVPATNEAIVMELSGS